MGKSNIIEINGKRYDARSGELLSSEPVRAAATHHSGSVVSAAPAKTAARTIQVNAEPSRPAAAKSTSTTAKARVHDAIKARPQSRQQQHSKTLMRTSVAKPSASLKRHAKAQGHTDALVDKPASRLQPKASVKRVDDRRLASAQSTPKSQAVSRFSKQPAGPAPRPPSEIPRPTHKPHGDSPDYHPAAASQPPRDQASAVTGMVERALRNATSHEQTYAGPKRRRLPNPIASLTTVVAALIVLGSFVAYQNMTTIKVHLASSKAGFTASAPDYQPAGYHLSRLNAAPGVVAFNYQNGGAGRYAITEKTSNWDSDALRDSFLATSGQSYQSVQTGGQTVYLYGQNAATWVNGGVWYQVQSSGSLSDSQLVQLAASL